MTNSSTRNTWSTLAANLSLLFIALMVSLLAGEFFLRSFFPQRLYYNVSQWDPYVGFSLVPNAEGYSKHEDYTMHIKINSKGLRDREFAYQKPVNTLRIGIFGDSFTFGEGVQSEEAYPKLLEALLNREDTLIKTQKRVEVLNFGIGKTGTSHQLAWYRKEGRKYNLDMVILGFLSANDFTDNWSGVFNLKDDELVHNPLAYSSIRKIQKIVHRIPFYDWLAANSHLVNFAKQIATIIDDQWRMRRGAEPITIASEEAKAFDAEIYHLTLRLIKEFQKEVLRDGACFMLVNVPAKDHRPMPGDPGRDKTAHYEPHVISSNALIKELAQTGVGLLDLVPVFADLPVSKYYFKHDSHMTVFGHGVMAATLRDALLPEVVGRARETMAPKSALSVRG